MARPFLTDAGKAALLDAVRAVEARSAAEVVVAVRERSGSYLHADLIAGIVAANLVLFYQLFSPWEFSLPLIQVAPTGIGLLVGLATSITPWARRALTPRRTREAMVRTAARATFVDKGVAGTRERTGILVYVAVLERTAEVVADLGVTRAVAAEPWTAAIARVAESAHRGDAAAVATAVAALAEVLAPALPRSVDDVNELADEVGAA
jgi:putative membrane protein